MITFDAVSKRYPGGQEALNQVSFNLARGELAFLSGHSGAGKSTLLKLLLLMERPSQGQILVGGQNLARISRRQLPYYRRQIGVVFQDHQLLFERSVFDNVALPLQVTGLDPREIGRRVRAALDKVGLLHKERQLPQALSGGEQQRVGIARAVVHRPPLLLADEPTGNLDAGLSAEIMNLFEQFNAVGVTMLIASHDLALLARHQHRRLRLEQGRLLADDQPAAAASSGSAGAVAAPIADEGLAWPSAEANVERPAIITAPEPSAALSSAEPSSKEEPAAAPSSAAREAVPSAEPPSRRAAVQESVTAAKAKAAPASASASTLRSARDIQSGDTADAKPASETRSTRDASAAQDPRNSRDPRASRAERASTDASTARDSRLPRERGAPRQGSTAREGSPSNARDPRSPRGATLPNATPAPPLPGAGSASEAAGAAETGQPARPALELRARDAYRPDALRKPEKG